MTSVYGYSATAASNNASSPDGAPENMASSGLNDTIRKMMANLAEFAIAQVAGGTADALTLTPTNTLAAYVDGMQVHFRAANANATTTPTLAISGLTARTIVKNGGSALAAGDIPGALAECIVRYNLANTRWELLNPKVNSGTVTSVAASVPSILSLAGSPITSSGTLAITLANQAANRVFAGPASGADAAPTFRALVNADIPSFPLLIYEDQKSDGTVGGTATTGSWTKHALGTEVRDTGNNGSVSSDVITLAAGTYDVMTEALIGGAVGGFRTRWRDTSNSATYALSLTGGGGGTSTKVGNFITTGSDRFTISGSTNFELQYFAEASAGTTDLGQHDNVTAGVEVYARVRLVKVA